MRSSESSSPIYSIVFLAVVCSSKRPIKTSLKTRARWETLADTVHGEGAMFAVRPIPSPPISNIPSQV